MSAKRTTTTRWNPSAPHSSWNRLTDAERERADRILDNGVWNPAWVTDAIRRQVLDGLKQQEKQEKKS